MIHVVTEVPEPGDRGNLAVALGQVYLDPQATGGGWDDSPIPLHEVPGLGPLVLYIQLPVFQLGEILHLDASDRDQFGRKPSKWSVTIEEFDTWEGATQRAREVLS